MKTPLSCFAYLALLAVVGGFSQTHAHEDCVKHPEGHPHCPGDPTGGGSGEQVTCDAIYYGGSNDPATVPQYCSAADGSGGHCMLDPPNDNTPGWSMSQDCQINSTLVVPPEFPFLSGRGVHTLYLGDDVIGWLPGGGDAGIRNGTSSIRVADMSIFGRAGTVTGCAADGDDGVSTAVRLNPDLPGDAGPGLPRMSVANLTIRTEYAETRFCNAIEYAGTDGEIATPYFAGGASGNVIESDAYERYGILLSAINTTDNVTGDYDVASISENDIQSSDVGDAAIMVQDVERANLANNTLHAPRDGVGLHILRTGTADADSSLGDFLESRPIVLEKNSVDVSNGTATGFVIDTSRVNTNRGNNVDGSGLSYEVVNPPSDDTEGVEFPTTGKRINTCNGSTPITAAGQNC